MKTVQAILRGIASYSQSKHYVDPKLEGESDRDHYMRTWRGHLHTDGNGLVLMPSTQLKNSLAASAKFLNMKIPGQGNATFTKNFEAGVLCLKSNHLLVPSQDKKTWVPIHRDQVECESLFLSPTGERGGKKRVDKFYPVFPFWMAQTEFSVLDDTCLQTCANPKNPTDRNYTVFEKVLTAAGQFIGLGRFRPRQNGNYGRFVVEDFQIIDDGDETVSFNFYEDDEPDDKPRKRPNLG